jgi:peptide deformylase
MDVAAIADEVIAKYHPGPAPLVLAGDPVLRRRAVPWTGQVEGSLLTRLREVMFATVRAAPGVGLAAPQIGIPLQMAVLVDAAEALPEETLRARERTPLAELTVLNPGYDPLGEHRAGFYEGCLSVPGFQAVVNRAHAVRARYLDVEGVAHTTALTGWPARIFQHETDHLHGVLYLDKAETRSLSTSDTLLERWNDPYPAAAAAELGFTAD